MHIYIYIYICIYKVCLVSRTPVTKTIGEASSHITYQHHHRITIIIIIIIVVIVVVDVVVVIVSVTIVDHPIITHVCPHERASFAPICMAAEGRAAAFRSQIWVALLV